MDYASEIDELGLPARRRRRSDASFMVIAVGTVCIAAGWILTASDPYTELANRVVEVRVEPAAESVGETELFELALDPVGPAAATSNETVEPVTFTAGSQLMSGEEFVEVPPEQFIGPQLPEGPVFEETLALTRNDRRAIQRRLSMAGHDAGPADGVFGPKTREAIASYRKEWGFAEDGHLDPAMLSSLFERTDEQYATWVKTERSRVRHMRHVARVTTETSPMPPQRVATAPGDCARKRDGSVIGHQSVGCDLRGFGEGLRDLVRGRLASSGTPQLESAAGVER